LVFSCGSGPKVETPKDVENAGPEKTETKGAAIEETFDPSKVSQEQYVTTRQNVQRFIENINNVITKKDFNTWRSALSSEYIAEISSPENLDRISETKIMKDRKIVLRNLEDYFNHVVVPSRANVNNRVDNIDIEFAGENRVKAFAIRTTNAGEEQRVRLYDLEKDGDLWKIIN